MPLLLTLNKVPGTFYPMDTTGKVDVLCTFNVLFINAFQFHFNLPTVFSSENMVSNYLITWAEVFPSG